MIRRTIAFAGLLMLCGCATAPVSRTATASVAPRAVAAPTAVYAAGLRDAMQRVVGLRPVFRDCVEAAAGASAGIQACIASELDFQQARLDTALATRRTGGSDAAQTQWQVERDRLCGPDGAGTPDAQRLQAGLCRLEATAARADALAR